MVLATVEVAPAEVAPAEVARAGVVLATVEVAPAEVAPAEVAPAEVASAEAAGVEAAGVEVAVVEAVVAVVEVALLQGGTRPVSPPVHKYMLLLCFWVHADCAPSCIPKQQQPQRWSCTTRMRPGQNRAGRRAPAATQHPAPSTQHMLLPSTQHPAHRIHQRPIVTAAPHSPHLTRQMK